MNKKLSIKCIGRCFGKLYFVRLTITPDDSDDFKLCATSRSRLFLYALLKVWLRHFVWCIAHTRYETKQDAGKIHGNVYLCTMCGWFHNTSQVEKPFQIKKNTLSLKRD